MTSDQSGVVWTDGVPVSARFDDPYYSLEDGLAETRHVFLDGNDLPARLRPGFHVAELGVGTGLNLLALASIAPVPVHYTGFEAYPLARDDLRRALSAFPGLANLATGLIDRWDPAGFATQIGHVTARMIVGDARRTLPPWTGQADAWFLDGFSPAKNPELWDPALLREVAVHTAEQGTFATYSAAGAVRRALAEAGFTVQRTPGYGRKRHMSRGHLTRELAQ